MAPKPLLLTNWPRFLGNDWTNVREQLRPSLANFYDQIKSMRDGWDLASSQRQNFGMAREPLPLFSFIEKAYQRSQQNPRPAPTDDDKKKLWEITRGQVLPTLSHHTEKQYSKDDVVFVMFWMVGGRDVDQDLDEMTTGGKYNTAAIMLSRTKELSYLTWNRLVPKKKEMEEELAAAAGSGSAWHKRHVSSFSTSSWDLVSPANGDEYDADSNSHDVEEGWKTVSALRGSPKPSLNAFPFVADGSFILAPDGLAPGTVPTPEGTIPLTSPLNPFVRDLAGRFLQLSSAPSRGGPPVPLADADVWLKWLRRAFPGVSPAALRFSPTEWPLAGAASGHFDLAITLDSRHSLYADTRTTKSVLGLDQPTVDKMISLSLVLPMGVAFAQPQPARRWPASPRRDADATWKVSDVSRLAGVKHTAVEVLGPLPLQPFAGGRNALWCEADMSKTTTLRLEFKLTDEARTEFSKWLGAQQKALVIENVYVVARRTAVCQYGRSADAARAKGELTFRLDLKLQNVAFSAFVLLAPSEVTLRLQRDAGMAGSFTLEDVVSWIGTVLGLGSIDDCRAMLEKSAGFLSRIKPRVIELALGFEENGSLKGITRMATTLQVELDAGKSRPDDRIVFFLTFGWTPQSSVSFQGRLWCAPPPSPTLEFETALPSWEPWLQILPDVSGKPLDHVDLKALCNFSWLPRGIPTEIRAAEISVDGKGMEVRGMLVCADVTDEPGNVPMMSLEFLDVWARVDWPKKGTSATFSCNLAVNVLIHAQSVSPLPEPAQMYGGLSYGTGAWTLSARISNLTGAHLASFFPKGSNRDSAMEMLKNMSIDSLKLTYEYDGSAAAQGTGKSFAIGAVLRLGWLRLGLDFYNKGRDDWEFKAGLSPETGSFEGTGDPEAPGGGEGSRDTTVGDILKALLGTGDTTPLPLIPGAVKDIKVTRPGSDKEMLNLKCKMIKGPEPGKGAKAKGTLRRKGGKSKPLDEPTPQLLVLVASVHISSISMTFIQWRNPSWPPSVPSKRVIKVTVDQIGPFQAPLVGELKAPFDQLVYMWVADKATEKMASLMPKKTAGEKPAPGITKGELDALKNAITHPADALFYKADKEYANDEVAIAAGSHFMVVAKNSEGASTAMLDYVFARPSTPKPPKQLSLVADGDGDGDDGGEKPNKDPAKAPLKKAMGPLTIENVGLQYDVNTKRLAVVLDATFLLGPIGLALLGFSLSCKLQPAGTSAAPRLLRAPDDFEATEDAVQPASLPVSDFGVSLAGLIVSFDKDPLTIAGGFMHTKVDNADYYAGGLIFKFKPWMMMAAGVYGKQPREKNSSAERRRRVLEVISDSDESSGDDTGFERCETDSAGDSVSALGEDGSFTMVFVIFKLEGPLFSVGFADISGLTGGVGVNSSVRLPTAETVLSFPFVRQDGTDVKGGPIAALKSLLYPDKSLGPPWFTAREGSFWVAAGCKVTAFTMLNVDAVLVLQLNPDVQLGVYGVATMDVPSLAAPVKFAHVELGIACTIDIGAGVFRLDAQLSPRSFVLHESCHLTGGMALYAWFGGTKATKYDPDRPSNGDFVLTIGGYHQAFVRPPQYPNPPRLAISWALGSSLKITGEAYFAVTPRVCMGGGRLHAALSAGPLSAWFDAFIDFLINYRPFYFTAAGGLAVGVRFSMDLWLVTVRISAEISATLTVMGPPMAGTVHVDFWVFGFDINFGDLDAARHPPPKLELSQFEELALKSGDGSGKGQGIPLGWVDLGENDQDERAGEMAGKDTQTAKPFLFNCDMGLIPNNSVAGTTSASSFPEVAAWHAPLPTDTWIVRGAAFSCTITLGFAATDATLLDKRPTAYVSSKTAVIADEQRQVFARPMQLRDPLASSVTVTITKQDSNALRSQPNERTDKEWGIQPVLKAVPQSIWGKYSPSDDPSVAGNGVGSLLDGRKTGSMTAVMGLTITPPLPFKSRDTLPKINMQRDMLQSVNKDGFPFPDAVADADDAWDPRPLTDEQKKNRGKRWDDVVDMWNADGATRKPASTDSGMTRSEKVVRAWAARLRFDEGALTGRKPSALISRFDDMVPAAPAIAVGGR